MRFASLTALLVLCLAPAARADAMADLQARFKARFPQISELKRTGTAGEAASGLLEFVKGPGDAGAQQLVAAENSDRQDLYKLLAAKEGATPEQVAKVSAERHFEKARPGEWLKGPDGQWKQKG